MTRVVTRSFSYILLPILSVLFMLVAGEVVLRVYHFTKEGMPIERWPEYLVGHYWTSTLDDYLGWKATENYQLVRHEETAYGKKYDVILSQDARGFRQFGNLDSKKPRIFVIGDSFTHAREVSDGKAYYARCSEAEC